MRTRHTGRLVLGGGEILGSFGYGPDLSIYELVHELRFDEGRLVEAIDRSGEFAAIAEALDSQ